MAEEADGILIDKEKRTLYYLERYFSGRRERIESGQKDDQDWFLDLLCDFINTQDDEDAERSPQPDDVQQALRLISNRLDAIDRKMPKPKETMPRAMQFAKARCQAMAKYLWHTHPDMTREEMARHEAVYNLSITEGKRYEIETVKKWIAKVDPRPPEKKRGRPRKAKK
jgi:hypothetical protein